jgi:hypothetical protein
MQMGCPRNDLIASSLHRQSTLLDGRRGTILEKMRTLYCARTERLYTSRLSTVYGPTSALLSKACSLTVLPSPSMPRPPPVSLRACTTPA